MRICLLATALILYLIMTACDTESAGAPPNITFPTSTPPPTAAPEPTATEIPPTPTPEPTNTPEPPLTPSPTNTPLPPPAPEPTNTPEPPPTPEPTSAPRATATPEPSNTPEPTPTSAPANTPEPTATNTPEPTATNTPEPTATNTPEPTATNTPANTPEPTATPTPTNTPEPTATPTPTNTPKPTATPVPVTDAAFARFNDDRQRLGLSPFVAAVEDDDSFIPVQEFLIGCYESADNYPELQGADLDAIALSESTGGSECGLKVVTYHIVPMDKKQRVERGVWECFSDSRDLQEPSDISCGGRYSAFGRHVRWHPEEIFYTIAEGAGMRDKFLSYAPWIEEKLKIKVSEAESAETANLFLHLGVQSPPNCQHALGCNIYEELEDKRFATIYVSADAGEYFGQVIKHELLHSLIPMGHLPVGNYLMSVRPEDPSQTHDLSPLEEKLLALYNNPYLREDMTMEQFQRYLVIVD